MYPVSYDQLVKHDWCAFSCDHDPISALIFARYPLFAAVNRQRLSKGVVARAHVATPGLVGGP